MAEANASPSETESSGNQDDVPSNEELKTQNYAWDRFDETFADSTSSKDNRFWHIMHKVAKVIFVIILFVTVLCTSVLHKSTVFLLISNIAPPNTKGNSSMKTSSYHFMYRTSETATSYIWALVLVVISPYVFTTLSSLWNLMFKKSTALKLKPLLLTLLVETIHSVGISLFVFGLLPNLDPLAGTLFCMNVVTIPAVLRLIPFGGGGCDSKARVVRRTLRLLGVAVNISSMACWTYYLYKVDTEWQKERPGLLVISVLTPILVSVVWWDNFVPKKPDSMNNVREQKADSVNNVREQKAGSVKNVREQKADSVNNVREQKADSMNNLRDQIQDMRSKIYAIVSIWKTLITICMVSILYGTGCENGTKCLEVLYRTSYGITPEVNNNNSDMLSNEIKNNVTLDHWLLGPTALISGLTDGSCSPHSPLYIALVNIISALICFRCCVAANKIQTQIPGFSLPLVLTTPITLVFMIVLYFRQPLPLTYFCFLQVPKWQGQLDFDGTMIAASIFGYIAIVVVTSHIWILRNGRMQTEERMFSLPMYCGLFLDQSLILNRKRTEGDTNSIAFNKETNKDGTNDDNIKTEPGEVPKIYLCATMWHENENEMTQLLKSLFRLDIDQFHQWAKQWHCNIENPDYYNFEAHIFFDDAFETRDGNRTINEYVERLIKKIHDAYRSMYVNAEDMKMSPPLRADTPYGRRFVWKFPFENILKVHLKDKEKIRHRKRWSQVMYMYYLLKDQDGPSAENTFILALDGDVDFQPSSLKHLVDTMKRNSSVGAACGRILPIGIGPMVWYQKFEYAVSHWLQKATEHTIGCVLCSPGCFSLFRGSHLMATNVIKRYTTPPSEARHYVQYDQGEDRWLCTLLLQKGSRVEYCAAADAFTYAPEGFAEFYNQRRRWTPSTMANILDLLLDFRNVTKNNSNISKLYIGYQMLLMVSSILTPGTIFLMIIGSINMAYPSLSLYWALTLNLIPVALFIILCFLAKPSTQLAYAAVLSTVYSLVMMLVIVGLIKQAADNGFCSVTTMFLCFVVGVFIIAAFIHPQECWCIIHGFQYFLAIPSMSMLLMLYSIGNLHVVSWGTRETSKSVTDETSSENKKTDKRNAVQKWLGDIGIAQESQYMCSFGNLFRCCPSDKVDDQDAKFKLILEKLSAMELALTNKDKTLRHVHFHDETNNNTEPNTQTESVTDKQDRDDQGKKTSNVPVELCDNKMKRMRLKAEKNKFWRELIDTYLFPLNEDKDHQRETQAKLVELRNKVCLFFILTNALFVTIVFSLQQVNLDSGGSISTELPCANGNHGGSFEPISMAFTGVFGILLLIQFICMIIHRISTFLQISSITEVREKHHNDEEKIKRNIETLKELALHKTKEHCAADDDDMETDADDLENEETIENEGYQKRIPKGIRAQYEEALNDVMNGNKEELRKSYIGADDKTLNDAAQLIDDKNFLKSFKVNKTKMRGNDNYIKRKSRQSVPQRTPLKLEFQDKSKTVKF